MPLRMKQPEKRRTRISFGKVHLTAEHTDREWFHRCPKMMKSKEEITITVVTDENGAHATVGDDFVLYAFEANLFRDR